jgi:hypothetical protein
MPRIPQYQQDKLASSAVGTAGVDNSGAQLANTVASAAGNASNQLLYLGGQLKQEEYRQQQQVLAVQAAQKKMADGVSIAQHSAAVQAAMAEANKELQIAYASNPNDIAKAIPVQEAEILARYTEENGLNPEVAAGVTKSIYNTQNERINKGSSWAAQRNTDNVKASLDSMVDSARKQAATVGSVQGVVDLFDAPSNPFRANQESIVAAVGLEKYNDMIRTGKTHAIEDYLNALALTPEGLVQMKAELKDPSIFKHLNATDAAQMHRTWQSFYSRQQAEQERIVKVDNRNALTDLLISLDPSQPLSPSDKRDLGKKIVSLGGSPSMAKAYAEKPEAAQKAQASKQEILTRKAQRETNSQIKLQVQERVTLATRSYEDAKTLAIDKKPGASAKIIDTYEDVYLANASHFALHGTDMPGYKTKLTVLSAMYKLTEGKNPEQVFNVFKEQDQFYKRLSPDKNLTGYQRVQWNEGVSKLWVDYSNKKNRTLDNHKVEVYRASLTNMINGAPSAQPPTKKGK